MRKNKTVWTVGVMGMLWASASWALAEVPYYNNPVWSQQIGTYTYDYGHGVAVDSSNNVYLCGYTGGYLDGTSFGFTDIFLRKYDNQQNLVWARQVGTSGSEYGCDLAVDSSGNIFVSGHTSGNLGGTNAGGHDAFLIKYDDQGNLLWSRQIGTSGEERNFSVAVDTSGNAYITGYTTGNLAGSNAGNNDVFLVKYDSQGNLIWSRQIGTSNEDFGLFVAVDSSGSVYITGYTGGNLCDTNAGEYDVFLIKYSDQGNILWSRQIGTIYCDQALSVAVDTLNNIYICGYTNGNLCGTNAGGWDIFLIKYNDQGNIAWSRQLGTNFYDYSYAVKVDTSGIYVTGSTLGSLDGTNAGIKDALLIKYSDQGNLLWARQIGSSNYEESFSVAMDTSGNVYIAGWTLGNLFGTNVGEEDGFLAKYSPALPGDANLDGTVDVGDLGILSANYGTTSGATWSMGDFNGDGAVDIGDLGILSAHYGESI